MTIKRNGEKVILKDGKVSCSCCEEPGGCCMYPAAALVDGLYTVDDLPDEVLFFFGGGGYQKLNPPQQRDVDGQAITVYYGSTFEGLGIIEGSGAWSSIVDEAFTFEGPCLFSEEGGNYKDDFADTYTATDPQGNPPITLTRKSLCLWEGPEPDLYALRYFDDTATTGFQCKWAFIDSLKDEGQFQNTPTGDYTQPVDENPWVIS
jgi:hypothetical protein